MLNTHVDKLLWSCRHSLYGFQDPTERFQQLTRFFLEVYAVSRDQHVVLLTCLDFLAPENQKELIADDMTTAHIDTMLFFGMINWTYTWYKADGAISPEQLADRTVELFINGYTQVGRKS